MAKSNPWDAIPSLKYDMEGIKDAISIRDALMKYCNINAGNGRKSFSCPSPDHSDKTPSCSVNTKSHDTQCHCFGCQRNFDVFDLARIAKGDVKFGELVESVCSDFGLDARDFSNYYEREAMIQRVFHTKEFTFVDLYSRLINSSEQEFLGLHDSNGKNCEIKYNVDALEYELKWFNMPDKETLWHEIYEHRMKREDFESMYQNPDGSKKIIEISRGEAANIMEWFDAGRYVTDENGREHYERFPEHEYVPPYHLSEMWKDNKYGVEEMLFNKCIEGYENTLKTMNALASAIKLYEKAVNVNAERAFVEKYEQDKWQEGVTYAQILDRIDKGRGVDGARLTFDLLKKEYQSDEAQRRIRCFYRYDGLRPKLTALADKLPEYQRIQDKMLSYIVERQNAFTVLGKPVDGMTVQNGMQVIDTTPAIEFQRKYPDLVHIQGMDDIYEQAYKMYVRNLALEMGADEAELNETYPIPEGWQDPWGNTPKEATTPKEVTAADTNKGDDTAPIPPQDSDVPPQSDEDGMGLD